MGGKNGRKAADLVLCWDFSLLGKDAFFQNSKLGPLHPPTGKAMIQLLPTIVPGNFSISQNLVYIVLFHISFWLGLGFFCCCCCFGWFFVGFPCPRDGRGGYKCFLIFRAHFCFITHYTWSWQMAKFVQLLEISS